MSTIASETIVGEHVVSGRAVQIQRTTWTGHTGLSYDPIDAASGDVLTLAESWNAEPSLEQMQQALSQGCRVSPEGVIDSAGFCTAHGWDCADHRLAQET